MEMFLRLYKAVANQKRIDILALLLKHGELALEEVHSELRIPQAAASRNLKILENANFVYSEYRKGRVFYSIVNNRELYYNKAVLDSIRKWKRGKR